MSSIDSNMLIPKKWINQLQEIFKDDVEKQRAIAWYILTYGATNGQNPVSTGDPMLDGAAMPYTYSLKDMTEYAKEKYGVKTLDSEIAEYVNQGYKAREIYNLINGEGAYESLPEDQKKSELKTIYNSKEWKNRKKSKNSLEF